MVSWGYLMVCHLIFMLSLVKQSQLIEHVEGPFLQPCERRFISAIPSPYNQLSRSRQPRSWVCGKGRFLYNIPQISSIPATPAFLDRKLQPANVVNGYCRCGPIFRVSVVRHRCRRRLMSDYVYEEYFTIIDVPVSQGGTRVHNFPRPRLSIICICSLPDLLGRPSLLKW
jgi:hypothetical protein